MQKQNQTQAPIHPYHPGENHQPKWIRNKEFKSINRKWEVDISKQIFSRCYELWVQSNLQIYLQTTTLVASANPANRVFPIMDNEASN